MSPADALGIGHRLGRIERSFGQAAGGEQFGPDIGKQLREVDPGAVHERAAERIGQAGVEFALRGGHAFDERLAAPALGPLQALGALFVIDEHPVDRRRAEDPSLRQPLLGRGEELGVILGQGETTSGQRRHQPGGDLRGGGLPAVVHDVDGAAAPTQLPREQ